MNKSGFLSVPDTLAYEFFEQNRYKISEYKNYECICNNGFIKLYTIPTRVYWHAQNQFEHRVPDWKIHISVHHEDLKLAWNLIVSIFLQMNCRTGIKSIYLREASGMQSGRQITLYILKYAAEFDKSAFAGDFNLSIAEEHSQDYWVEMIRRIQQILHLYGIRSNGLADGDFKLGQYTSLRNEAFVKSQDNETYIYPPNNAGWNPLNHCIPIDVAKVKKELETEGSQSQKKKPAYYVAIPLFLATIGLLVAKKVNYMYQIAQ